MVSPILSIEPRKLVERQDDRQTYLQYDDEKFVKALFQVARKIIDAPILADRYKESYIDVIEDINANYFGAQEVNAATQGQFHKYDATAEDQLRETIVKGVSHCSVELRSLLDAHTTVVETTTTEISNQYPDPQEQRKVSNTFEQTIATCTMKAVCDGWFPTLQSYYFSLNPGERVAEGRERREQRLYGTEETEGVADRLAESGSKQITHQDVEELKRINKCGDGNGHPVIRKLLIDYDWVISS